MRLVTLTRELAGSPDLARLVAGAREAGWDGAVIERSVPDAVSVAALGRVVELVGDARAVWAEDGRGARLPPPDPKGPVPGPGLSGLATLWAGWSAAALALQDPGLPGTGLVAVGGFAFRPDVAPTGAWAGFPAVLLRVPELAVVRTAGRCFRVAATLASPAAGEAGLRRRLQAADRLLAVAGELRPDVGRAASVRASATPAVRARWEGAVARAAAALRAGRAEKVVLTREVMAHSDRPVSLTRTLAALRAAHPGCHTFAVGGADGTLFVGSSPELLVERLGDRVRSQPLAGTVGRSASARDDRRLAAGLRRDPKEQAEHRAVVQDIVERLAPIATRVSVGARPEVLRLPAIQHLMTTVGAHLQGRPPPTLLEVAALLHPTPAVGGRPRGPALELLAQLETLERGWYTGGIGWADRRGDGELALALRCGLLWGDGARCYAGAGIMPDSVAAREWEETELKLQPMLRALAS